MAATLSGQSIDSEEQSTDTGSNGEISTDDDEWDSIEKNMIAKH